jgi:hypothetical protein
MGTPILYARLSRFGVYPANRWHAPLSCQSPSLSKGSACLRAMVHCGSCMPHVSAIVVPARCRAQCQESGRTLKTRRVSAVVFPLSTFPSDSSPPPDTASAPLSSAPVLWRDWPRCGIRWTWLKVVRSQTLCLESSSQFSPSVTQASTKMVLTRAGRALASLLKASSGVQCPSIGRSPHGRHASRTASHLCFLVWL